MAVKSKEMVASAMKVVIRKHLVCMSLTVKIGDEQGPSACCGKWKAAALVAEGSRPGASEGMASSGLLGQANLACSKQGLS